MANASDGKELAIGSTNPHVAFLLKLTPNSLAFHKGNSEMLAPVSSNTVVFVTFFSVLGDGVFEEMRRE